MPSTRRPDQPRPVLFVDRSLGRLTVPAGIRDLGFSVHTLWEFYGVGDEERISDDQWIRDMSAEGWVGLTADMLRKPPSLRTRSIPESRARIFRFERQIATAEQQLAAFETNQHRLIQRARRPGPYIDVIRENAVDPYWPPPHRA